MGSCLLGRGQGGWAGVPRTLDQTKVELLSLTWLFEAHHLCWETFITNWLKAVLGAWVRIPPSSALYERGNSQQIA